MGLGRICNGCGNITSAAVDGYCPRCLPAHKRRDQQRRAAHPRRRIYDDPRWRPCREAVLKRDSYRCVDCKRSLGQLKPNELLIADHVDGLAALLARGGNPFDPAECQTRCSTCSGKKDGGRRPTIHRP
jgi:5-methylcytosine-specific restriction endonuclease McrA